MADKEALTILLNASRGRLDSNDTYRGKKIGSLIEIAIDEIQFLQVEVKRLNYLIKYGKTDRKKIPRLG
ncbi:hypothetical protein GW590_18635 [Rahnella sp. SAP-1]|jgi:hypothetical protein|uniref:Uncharacterized protein n=1 Tax=Rouxiella aceris TaxID=2703884 RepID=A0A848MP81_9GAMM|nr:hypothetical protein [Rouxiella aceris]NMP28879.1 hypothetical protein [Rouxiella aceris]